MGNGYWILIADGYGAGLVLLNPRMHVDGVDLYGNPCNWFAGDPQTSDAEILKKHRLLDAAFAHVIW
ncbi:MAG: hypothetical protein A2Z03_02195 [Chloroflexi bacterium RBG_16_56_8]|nr:MAG: hypothetical protein A2Z03_02195 [Chloroflexi bacterium RBG_16_56_8]